MWPLLLKDGLSLPYVSCMLLFYAIAYHVFDLGRTKLLRQVLVNMSNLTFVVHLNLGRKEFKSTLLTPSKGDKLDNKGPYQASSDNIEYIKFQEENSPRVKKTFSCR